LSIESFAETIIARSNKHDKNKKSISVIFFDSMEKNVPVENACSTNWVQCNNSQSIGQIDAEHNVKGWWMAGCVNRFREGDGLFRFSDRLPPTKKKWRRA
jgi:hypothetical protein